MRLGLFFLSLSHFLSLVDSYETWDRDKSKRENDQKKKKGILTNHKTVHCPGDSAISSSLV